MLIGLASKNAILIVEFAKQRREQGLSIQEAALEAARLRFRPILMTSFSTIFGLIPLILSTGAGAASRQALGTSVLGGMFTGAVFGVLFVPSFFVFAQKLSEGAWWSPRGKKKVLRATSSSSVSGSPAEKDETRESGIGEKMNP